MPSHVCGCYYFHAKARQRQYLPQVNLDAHTTILSTASRTVLEQKFINSSKEDLEEIIYAFPLFDGVSVVNFICRVGDRTIYGLVKETAEARKTYEDARERGEKAAILEQLPDAADVFTSSVSNIPKHSIVEVSVTYIQELKHDAEVDGIRLTVPTSISPRYGSYPSRLMEQSAVDDTQGLSLTVDISMAEGIPIKKIMSPSHPIEVSLGSISTSTIDEDPSISKASVTLVLGTAQLDKDFVLLILAKDVGIPQAILETHPTLPNQRALMTTLVPKFNLKSQKPEIIFIADRSGSMRNNVSTLISALKIFLKSIPIGCMFNICSFGSRHSFLWRTSQLYSQYTLAEAIDKFDANFGGTETLSAVKACFESRRKGMPTELMLLTDGDIWAQQQMFDYIHEQTKAGDVRMFPIGIGSGVSSALIEGVARAGNGFAQMVTHNEKLDIKIIRMLKGALTPHIKDYRLEVKYDDNSVESVTESLRVHLQIDDQTSDQCVAPADTTAAQPISLYDTDAVEEHPKYDESTSIFAGLPNLTRPKILQAPYEIPPLFPFNRTCIYLLLSPEAAEAKPTSVILKGTSPQGPLELEIPVDVCKTHDQMIHQLAARKATQELEENRGWVTQAITDGENPGERTLISNKYPAHTNLLQRREAVRLGIEFQVGGKYCSFVAVEANGAEIENKRQQAISGSVQKASSQAFDEWDIVPNNSIDACCLGSPEPDTVSREAVEEEREDSDDDMGYALFDWPESTKPLDALDWSAQYAPEHVSAMLSLDNMGQVDALMAFPSDPSASASSVLRRPSTTSCTGPSRGFLEGHGFFSGIEFDAEAAAVEKGKLLENIIAQQSFEGSWISINLSLRKHMRIPSDKYREAIDGLVISEYSLDRGKAEVVLSTAIVILYLEREFSNEEEVWDLVVEKAMTWFEDNVDDAMMEAAWAMATGLVQA